MKARPLTPVMLAILAERGQVTVTEAEHRGVSVVEVFMAPGELGRLIGRQGRTAQALRTLAQATAAGMDCEEVVFFLCTKAAADPAQVYEIVYAAITGGCDAEKAVAGALRAGAPTRFRRHSRPATSPGRLPSP